MAAPILVLALPLAVATSQILLSRTEPCTVIILTRPPVITMDETPLQLAMPRHLALGQPTNTTVIVTLSQALTRQQEVA